MPQKEEEIIELENYAKEGKEIPKDSKKFRIRIDNDKYLVEKSELTGAELLQLAGKNPEQYRILFKKHGGRAEEVLPDSSVSLLGAGVERFMTQKRQAQEG